MSDERVITEVRRLLGYALDHIVLPGHALSSEEWDRACLLSGRYCEPYLSHVLTDEETTDE